MIRLKNTIPLLLAIFIFIAFLGAVNLLQYSRLKDDLMTGIVSKVSDAELFELQSFFQGIEKSLQLIKTWGENDAFGQNTENLNKKLLPLLEHQKGIEGIIIANNVGQEYYLTRTEQGYLTRYTTVHDSQSEVNYNLWSKAHDLLESRDAKNSYDPRTRPWYVTTSSKDHVNWTKAYTFYESKKRGITASVSWRKKDSANGYVVFGMDITHESLQRVLSKIKSYNFGIPFLVGKDGKYLLTRKSYTSQPEDQNDKLISNAIRQWQAEDRPLRKIVKGRDGGQSWFVSFQKVDLAGGVSWLGVLLPESVLDNLFHDSLLRVSFWDIAIALLGVLGVAFLLRRTHFWGNNEETVPAEAIFLHYRDDGEGDGVEFKSTIRTNLKTGKHGKEVELAWLKAITAFLNSAGGTLLLGVSDDGTVCGVDVDEFENDDKCLLHIKNLLNHHIGAEFSDNISTKVLTVEHKKVAMLKCTAAGTPVFLKIGKNEEFYIRSGPSSMKLIPSQIVDFVKKNKL